VAQLKIFLKLFSPPPPLYPTRHRSSELCFYESNRVLFNFSIETKTLTLTSGNCSSNSNFADSSASNIAKCCSPFSCLRIASLSLLTILRDFLRIPCLLAAATTTLRRKQEKKLVKLKGKVSVSVAGENFRDGSNTVVIRTKTSLSARRLNPCSSWESSKGKFIYKILRLVSNSERFNRPLKFARGEQTRIYKTLILRRASSAFNYFLIIPNSSFDVRASHPNQNGICPRASGSR
jgi:hypothetical protein